jgi:hypothetical protein
MAPLDLIDHLLNFAAPALFVGFFLALVSPWVLRMGRRQRHLALSGLMNSLCGLCALTAGLWFFGNDGTMASYGALLVASAASQLWFMQSGH